MGKLRQQIIGYHCNEQDKIDKFKNREMSLLISYEDDIWLGNGMYFWENKSNLDYWKRNRENKYPDINFSSVEAMLSLEFLLDLSDKDHRKFCKRVLRDLIDRGKDNGIDESMLNKDLGEVINVLFSRTDILTNHFDVLRIHGLYNWEEDKFLVGNDNKYQNINRPTSNVKTIYCVKNEKAVLEIL
ncbi:hypothetical protein ACWEXW_09260 [Staphylococcus xylosus]|uniref:hypothetical protein n=1 Tax=Staphylococcus xylosus TaxID=1288 RepID=UPI00118C420A|nr:hypothetical protein [Staphylococcus xylosus]MDW4124422.1 hypothetical protein [Staphylococcus saprophyticus]MDW4516703.1 hypothetical protein [Staphylococcus saprophyticus]QDW89742.1 hypothetical protein DWB98_09965 [Staphylococcus xylosus]